MLSRCQHSLGFCSASRTLINLPPRGAYLYQSFISLHLQPPVVGQCCGCGCGYVLCLQSEYCAHGVSKLDVQLQGCQKLSFFIFGSTASYMVFVTEAKSLNFQYNLKIDLVTNNNCILITNFLIRLLRKERRHLT